MGECPGDPSVTQVLDSHTIFIIVTINFTGTEFKANKHLTDPKEIEFCIRLADTNLDTVLIQAEHLTNLIRDPNYQTDV